MDVVIREGLRNNVEVIFVDCFNAVPLTELYVDISSKAVGSNDDLTGISSGLHKTVKADGTCTFYTPKEFMLPNVPREITVRGPLAQETFA